MDRTNVKYALLLVLLLAAGVYAYISYSATAALGVLEVVTEPEGAQVTINGEERGNTPLVIEDVTLGFRDLTLEKEGYDSYHRRLHFRPHQQQRVDLILSREDLYLEEILSFNSSMPREMVKSEDRLVCVSSSGELAVLDFETTELVWQQDMNLTVLASPAVLGDTVLMAGFRGQLLAFNLSDGELLWKKELEKGVRRVLAAEDSFYLLHSDYSTISALGADGQLLWSERTPDSLQTLLPGEDNLLVVGDSGVLIQDLEKKENRDWFPFPGDEVSYLGNDGQDLFFYYQGTVYSFDIRSKDYIPLLETLMEGDITAFAVQDDRYYLAAEKELIAFKDGRKIWKESLDGVVSYLHSNGDSNLLAATENNSLFFLDYIEGNIWGRESLRSRVTGILNKDENMYYLGLHNGNLMSLRLD